MMNECIPNTFGLSVKARQVVAAKTPQALCEYWQYAKEQHLPVMILGGGSNTLFTTNFDGIVILNGIEGIHSKETETDYLLRVGAGVLWHDLVRKTIADGQPGLENLAMIPGTVGSAPIQNIGAYGAEFKQFSDYVEIIHLDSGERETVHDGQYGYRDSIFKHQYRKGVAIIYVGIKLPKQWMPSLLYSDLQTLVECEPTPQTIFDFVCTVRKQKLPDPALIGNGGSFFKNPVVSEELVQTIRCTHPDLPVYPNEAGGVKLAAGWLIDQCGLKGFELGGAAVHENQALVIINKHHATPSDIVKLASLIRYKVAERFGVELEPEIRFIGKKGEIDAIKLLNDIARKDFACET